MTNLANNGYAVVVVVIGSLAIHGCGIKESAETRLTPVEGTISLDGKPLAHADIEFHFKGTVPESYQGAASRSDENGVFQVKSGGQLGTLPGPHIVTVKRAREIPNEEPSREIPEQYTSLKSSKLEIDVRKDQWIGYHLQLSTSAD